MAEPDPPYWLLISVLFSTVPLSSELATSLHQVAAELYRREENVGEVKLELARGRVTNLKKEACIGSIAGPVFEASLETERGQGMVQFLLTRQGLELEAAARPPPSAQALN